MGATFYTTSQAGLHTTANASWQTALTLSVGDDVCTQLDVVILARTAAGDVKAWRKSVCVARDASGNASVIGAVLDIAEARGSLGALLWDARVQASGADVIVEVKGKASTTVEWVVATQGQVLGIV